MRYITIILLSLVNFNVHCQKNNLEFGKYSLRKYHWTYIGYTSFQMKNWRSSFGFGINMTPLYNFDKAKSLAYYPRANSFIENFNLYVNIEKDIYDEQKNISYFVFNRINIGKSSFYQTNVEDNGEGLNISYSYSNPKWIIDNIIGIGFQAIVHNKITFYWKAGCSISIPKSFLFTSDYGLIFSLNNK